MSKPKFRTVAISGASAGIGAACAEAFAREGFAVALGARREERLTDLATRCKELGAAKVLVQALDVRSDDSVDRFAAAVQRELGPVDVLVNNAGLAVGVDPVATGKVHDWETMIDTNVTGLLRLTRKFLPAMIERKAGHVVNMGSIAGFQTYAGGAVYAGTKHMVRAITGALRYELNGTPIRVSEIDPGMVESEFSEVRLQDDAKAKAVYSGMTPLTPADIADCVVFAATRPPHVNIEHILIMPTDQASVYKVHRQS